MLTHPYSSTSSINVNPTIGMSSMARLVLDHCEKLSKYFIYYRLFRQILPPNESEFFQDILNIAAMPRENEDPDGWMLCTIRFLSNRRIFNGWDERSQQRLLKSLEDKGYLEVDYRPTPRSKYKQRYIRLCPKLIHFNLEQAFQRWMKCTNNQELDEPVESTRQSVGQPSRS